MHKTLLLSAVLTGVLMIPPAVANGERGQLLYEIGVEAYDNGRYADAIVAWEIAMGDGHVSAMSSLADLLIRGQGAFVDRARAFDLYRRAADGGDTTAMVFLGERAEALDERYWWFALAARQGHAWAGNQLTELRRDIGETRAAEIDQQARRAVSPPM